MAAASRNSANPLRSLSLVFKPCGEMRVHLSRRQPRHRDDGAQRSLGVREPHATVVAACLRVLAEGRDGLGQGADGGPQPVSQRVDDAHLQERLGVVTPEAQRIDGRQLAEELRGLLAGT